MICDGCRGPIGGKAYSCVDCGGGGGGGFILCVHCIQSGCHSQHRVVECSGKGLTNHQKKSSQPAPKSAFYDIGFSQTCTVSPTAPPTSRLHSKQSSPGNPQHPVPAPSYLPYGVIPSAPVIDMPTIFPAEQISKTDTRKVSEERRSDSDAANRHLADGRRNSVRSIGEANALPMHGTNAALYRSLPVGTPRFVKEKTGGEEKERSVSQGDISVAWEPRKPGETFRRKLLQRTDEDFQAVLQNMSKNGGGDWMGKVVSVHRIENHRLYKVYKSRFKEMERENAGGIQNERILYHGTSADALTNICRDGFNRSYCGRNATAYGDGVYFARSIDYSTSSRYSPPDSNGHKYVFQCRVLTGYYAKGEPGLKEPPLIDQEIRFDSVVDDSLNPKIFVVFKDMQTYPEFLITLDA